MNNQKQFLTSVADVYIKHPITKNIIATAKTNLDSSIQVEVSNKEVYGGYGHQLLYEWGFQKKLKFTFTDNVFKEEYLAMQSGSGFKRESIKVLSAKEITKITNSTITLNETPVLNSEVIIEDGMGNIVKRVQATGKTIKLDNVVDGEVIVTYTTERFGEVLEIRGDKFPEIFEVEVIGQIIVPNGIDKELHIIMNNFKPNGNFGLDLKSDDISSFKIEGQAFVDAFGRYAKFVITQKENAMVGSVDMLATYKPLVKLTDKETTFKPVIIGVRNNTTFKNTPMLDDELTATVLDTGVAKINDKHEIEFVAAGNTEVTYALKDKPEVSLEINIECKKTV